MLQVYRLPAAFPLHFSPTSAPVFTACNPRFTWRTPTGFHSVTRWRQSRLTRAQVTDNRCGSANWLGLSVHNEAFNGLASAARCLKKSDFALAATGANNGDYKV